MVKSIKAMTRGTHVLGPLGLPAARERAPGALVIVGPAPVAAVLASSLKFLVSLAASMLSASVLAAMFRLRHSGQPGWRGTARVAATTWGTSQLRWVRTLGA